MVCLAILRDGLRGPHMPDGAGASSSAGLAEQARAVLAAALSGGLGPDAAAGHMALLGQMTKIEENSELRARIEALERVINGGAQCP